MDQRSRSRAPRVDFSWSIRSIERRHPPLPAAALDGTDTGCGCAVVPARRPAPGSGRRQRR
ncbi:MAG TPA: hypothetical protein VEA40_18095 [Ramlibacter sp.]|nr:hypothetical protein [Ramlibacter sp.]